MTFAPSPRTHTGFLEHVSRDIFGNETMPEDFESTLWYVLYQIPERNRDIFLKIERDCIPVRAIGLEYQVSGQRIHDLNNDTKNMLHSKWGDFLKSGIMQFMHNTANTAQRIGEESAKDIYYKLGYTKGYADGSNNKLQKHFSTEEFNAISLSDLALSYRTQHYLFNNDLLNVSQIVERGDDLINIRHLGKGSFDELITRLSEFGVDVHQFFPKMIKKYNIVVEDENV